jgi:hypothetical protein
MALKSEVAREYRIKHPDMASLKLARIVYNENKKLFKDVEDARYFLRRVEGKTGSKNQTPDKTLFIEKPRPYNPYKLPESDETSYEPYVLKGFKRAALLADVHAPYHNIGAISAALDYLKKDKPDVTVINGDTFDFHTLSRFMRDPRKKNFAEELKIAVSVLQVIEKTLRTPIILKLGNHCERYQNYLWQKLGELHGVDDFEFETILKKRMPDIVVVSDKRIIKANSLNVLHGHEFATSVFSPVNIARGLYLRAKANAIQAHNHKTSEHTEMDINGKITKTWSMGCLCELHPAYMPINSWNHGFTITELASNKIDFEVRNKSIYKGKVL